MDSGQVSLAQYNYQTTLAASGRKPAVLQALASTYDAAASAGSGDPLAAAVGGSAVGALASGITTLTGGKGVQDAQYPATFGGLSAPSATSLLAGLGTGSGTSGGLEGFQVDTGASLATSAYQARTTYASAATGTRAGNGTDAASLQAAKAAAAATASTALDLLG